ncbi:hypothetical protein ACFO1B_16670 [Dactylosporangium siamense]|uniref:PASTA domain-containing protein n=1 Tax=Dactylosporangium siamense TaxID=685454 RepID=A0A919UBC6_9ACTN|nr:hypothetical protein [Dactylosporangium siamense]GIG45476.1 hypothetical protein Dsi01nite_035170 [Dactylosporangium siamense]
MVAHEVRRHRAPRRFGRLGLATAGVACLGAGAVSVWLLVQSVAGLGRAPAGGSAPESTDVTGVAVDARSASPADRAVFPELRGLKCGQALQRLRLLGFERVRLVSVDMKIVDVSAPNDWSVAAEGAAPNLAGEVVALHSLITVRCQWDGAGIVTPPAGPHARRAS